MRIGNGAADQLQLDIYGEAMDRIFAGHMGELEAADRAGTGINNVLDWLAANWDHQPEEGIWETRGGRQAFPYGRLMSWVALDRGVHMAKDLGRPHHWKTGGGNGPDLPAGHGHREASPDGLHPGTRRGWRADRQPPPSIHPPVSHRRRRHPRHRPGQARLNTLVRRLICFPDAHGASGLEVKEAGP